MRMGRPAASTRRARPREKPRTPLLAVAEARYQLETQTWQLGDLQ